MPFITYSGTYNNTNINIDSEECRSKNLGARILDMYKKT